MLIKLLCPTPKLFSQKGLLFASERADLKAEEMSQSCFENMASDFDAVLVRFTTYVGKEVISGRHRNCRLRAIVSPTTGLDHLDLEEATKSNVKVYHLRNQTKFLKTITGTAELTLGLLISLARGINSCAADVKNGIWLPERHRGIQLSGRKLGIIGCGRLGTLMARYASALGMEIFGFDPFIKKYSKFIKPTNSLEDLLRKSDILTLHVPLSTETRHMISTEQINLLQPNALIINTSRGAIINSDAILSALKEKRIGGIALDVLEGEIEGLNLSHPLIDYSRNHKNCIITSHIGGATVDSVEKTDLFVLKKFFSDFQD